MEKGNVYEVFLQKERSLLEVNTGNQNAEVWKMQLKENVKKLDEK